MRRHQVSVRWSEEKNFATCDSGKMFHLPFKACAKLFLEDSSREDEHAQR